MTEKHISFTADEDIWKFLKHKSIDEDTTMKELILSAVKEKYDIETGDKAGDIEGSDKPEDIGISDLDPSIIEVSKGLEGGKYGSEETVREITLSNIRYLKNHGKASKSDFMSDVYPKFEGDHTENSYWKVSQEGFKQFSDLTDKIELATVGHKNYKWIG